MDEQTAKELQLLRAFYGLTLTTVLAQEKYPVPDADMLETIMLAIGLVADEYDQGFPSTSFSVAENDAWLHSRVYETSTAIDTGIDMDEQG